MVRKNYEALVSGDGACAGCGEKSILRAIASVTESYLRPLFDRRVKRTLEKAERLSAEGTVQLRALAEEDKAGYQNLRIAIAHIILGLGGENDSDTEMRVEAATPFDDQAMLDSVCAVLRQDARDHQAWQSIDGKLENGMAVMAMGAHTGCNTVYGSTPPNNPHPYPWMNSLFQDGTTISWLMGESFIDDHARRSVLPERIADKIMACRGLSDQDLFEYTHFTDVFMTHQEILEMPKVWAVGGDGGMGDIGFQNVSKVVLQNRPNVKLLMLDTQVYSNTGGQNSDSSPAPGGFDFNQFGEASQGKLIEKKGVAEILAAGHGSPFVAQVSMANAAKLYRTILDALEYRGTAFFQCFTSCQPEHGVGDNMSSVQATRIRDSRGMPEFTFHPARGETYEECFDLKGNPVPTRDWWETQHKPTKYRYSYTVAHWAYTEARFRRHFKKISEDKASSYISIDDMLARITQKDVVSRSYLNPEEVCYVPDFGVFIKAVNNAGQLNTLLLSRQMVLFCVERRKAWRILQSKAGLENLDYRAQRELLKKLGDGALTKEEFLVRPHELLQEQLTFLKTGSPSRKLKAVGS
jgi:pyruvate-ferredoxin/flavodoxin oxidoreductase